MDAVFVGLHFILCRSLLTAAVVCVALLNRLLGDKVTEETGRHLDEWQRRPQRLVAEMIRYNEMLGAEITCDRDRRLASELKAVMRTSSDSALEESPNSSRTQSPAQLPEALDK